MSQPNAIKHFFQRERKPGDLVFAIAFLVLSLFLLSQLGDQTEWVKRTKLFAQPAFWPAVSLIGMSIFAALHYLGSIMSPRIAGRISELSFWLKSLEFAAWFMLYVWLVPITGYLPTTILFALLLTFRVGYREKHMYIASVVVSVSVVVIFKGFLSVKIPGGEIYEYLPDTLRNVMLLYF